MAYGRDDDRDYGRDPEFGRDRDFRRDERDDFDRDSRRERVFRGDERPGDAFYAGGHYIDTPRRDRSREELEDRPRRHRYFGSTGNYTGVGSAAGYSGFGGPGWTPGGYGDPAFQTSGFGGPSYGTSGTGGPSGSLSDLDYRPPVSSRGSSMDVRDERPGIRQPHGLDFDRERPAQRGPHYGKGPKNYQRSDERIREEISDRLMEHDGIDASDIEVEVKDGEVTLTGTVEEREMKWMAEGVAETVGGVRDVHNRLKTSRR
jgi:hypothetical protein